MRDCIRFGVRFLSAHTFISFTKVFSRADLKSYFSFLVFPDNAACKGKNSIKGVTPFSLLGDLRVLYFPKIDSIISDELLWIAPSSTASTSFVRKSHICTPKLFIL